jgi:hypothetical protein
MPNYNELIDALTGVAEGAEKRRLRRTAWHAVHLFRALERRDHDPADVAEYLDRTEAALAEPARARRLSRIYSELLKHLEKTHGLVQPGHYRSQWMAIGMVVFGLPIGTAFGIAVDNTALVGVGLPIGLAIGLSVGSAKDKEAARKGLQLDMPEA